MARSSRRSDAARSERQYGATGTSQVAAANRYRSNPSEANALAAAEAGVSIPYKTLYQDLVLDPERKRLQGLEKGIRQQAQTSAAASAARNRQAVGRMGLGGTGFEDALKGSLTSGLASSLSDTIARRRARFADEVQSPNRLAPLTRVRDAALGKLKEEKAGTDAYLGAANTIGTSISTLGGPIGGIIGTGINIGAGIHGLAAGAGYNEEVGKIRDDFNAGNYARPSTFQPNVVSGSSFNTQGGSQQRLARNPFAEEDDNVLGGFRFA